MRVCKQEIPGQMISNLIHYKYYINKFIKAIHYVTLIYIQPKLKYFKYRQIFSLNIIFIFYFDLIFIILLNN